MTARLAAGSAAPPTSASPIRTTSSAWCDTALAEDLRYGPDATTAATVPADAVASAAFAPRAAGVLAGVARRPRRAGRPCDR